MIEMSVYISNTDAERMRLWTIQTKEAWEHAEKLGVLEFNEIADKEIDDWFRPAYNWMAGQLEERVRGYPCNKYPIWAWYHPKPDLRRSGHLPRDTTGVRVEFLVDSDRVLLSDFEAWHAVLNCWYLSLSEEEGENWDERSERAGIKGGWENWPPPSPFKEEILKSWERIFDPELLNKHPEWIGGETIQACIEKIYVNEVINITYFKAR